jgi:hypothetical protein
LRDWVPSFIGKKIPIEGSGEFCPSCTGPEMRKNLFGDWKSSILLENIRSKRVTKRVI